jgi:putative flippase GtrA
MLRTSHTTSKPPAAPLLASGVSKKCRVSFLRKEIYNFLFSLSRKDTPKKDPAEKTFLVGPQKSLLRQSGKNQVKQMDTLVQGREINAGHGLKPRVDNFVSARLPITRKFIKFCVVGGSGVFVDMGVLFLLADPRMLGLNITLSKICAAELAMINNFIWNELWTFHRSTGDTLSAGGENKGEVEAPTFNSRPSALNQRGVFRRFFLFNAICGIGMVLAILLLGLFHNWLGWNLYASNFLAIILITFWNFVLNAQFNWKVKNIP